MFQLIHVVINKDSFAINGYEEQLRTIVQNFYRRCAHPAKGTDYDTSNNSSNTSDDLVNFNVHHGLINNLQYIIQQLKNYRLVKLNAVRYDKENDGEIFFVQLSDYEQSMCTHIPRYLEFIYLCANQKQSYILLQRLYTSICTSWQQIVTKQCFLIDDKEQLYKCNKNIMVSLTGVLWINAFEDLYDIESNTLSITDQLNYIREIHTIMSYIDISQVIKDSIWFNEHNNTFLNVETGTHNITKTVSPVSEDNKEVCTKEKHDLNKGLQNSNLKYVQNMKDNSCYKPKLTNEVYEIPKLTYLLVRHIFNRLEQKIKNYTFINYNINTDLNIKEDYINHQDIDVNIYKIFNDLCKYAPTIVFYLKDYINNDTQLISLYLTFCSDNMDFYHLRCPTMMNPDNLNITYNLQCISHTLKNKIFVNYFYITNHISEIDEVVEQKNCANYMFEFIKNIHNSIENYYNCKSTTVWMTYNWLSMKYLLSGESNNPILNDLRNKTIHTYGLDMSLSMVYDKYLMWNLDTKSLLIFHNIILYNLDKIMNTYFYTQMKLIILYFKHMNYTVDNVESERLVRTLIWYEICKKIFYKHLCLSGTYKPCSKVDNIISIIKSCGNNTDLLTSIQTEIPKDTNDYLTLWIGNMVFKSKSHLPLDKNTFLETIRDVAVQNCMDTVDFINNFILIVNKSIKMREKKEEVNTNICGTELYEFFENIDDRHKTKHLK